MKLMELKQAIREDNLPNKINLIFKCEDDYFVADEYIKKIAEMTNREIVYVEALPNLFIKDKNLYVIKVDKLESDLLTTNKNVEFIICCKKTSLVNDSIIEFPKLEDWQLIDYVKSFSLNISEATIKELVSKCKNPYKLKNELIKITCFARANQENVCRDILNNSPDLFNTNIFNVTNGLLKRDLSKVCSFYHTDADVTGMYLLSIILKNVKNVIDIQINPRATADSLGVPYKQFKAIQYNCGYYSNEELIKIYKKFLSLDKKVKNGFINESQLVDYIIVNMIGG